MSLKSLDNKHTSLGSAENNKQYISNVPDRIMLNIYKIEFQIYETFRQQIIPIFSKESHYTRNTAERHLSRLTGMASHPDIQNIQIIGFFFLSRLHWQYEFQLLPLTACT